MDRLQKLNEALKDTVQEDRHGGASLGGQGLRLGTSNAGGVGLSPGQGLRSHMLRGSHVAGF